MKSIYAVCFAVISLAGCSSIPYETSEAKQQIKKDLGITEIKDASETNWCAFAYGRGAPQCRSVQGLGVLTPTGLVLSLYQGKTYKHIKTLTTEDVICSYSGTPESMPMLFTETHMLVIVPVTPNGQLNKPSLANFMAYLHSKDQKRLTGPETPHYKPNEEKNRRWKDEVIYSNPCEI